MPFEKGHKGYTPQLSEKHRLAISKANKGKEGLKGEKNGRWKGGKPKCIDCGKQLTHYYRLRCRKCHYKFAIKENNPFWKGGRPKCQKCKRLISYNTKNQLCVKCWSKEKGSKENHPNWKGGITPINDKIRKSKRYKNWCRKVFERDNWTCRECEHKNKVGYRKKLYAHHIKGFAEYPKLRFVVDNGIVLCEKCHKKTENYGIKLNCH